MDSGTHLEVDAELYREAVKWRNPILRGIIRTHKELRQPLRAHAIWDKWEEQSRQSLKVSDNAKNSTTHMSKRAEVCRRSNHRHSP